MKFSTKSTLSKYWAAVKKRRLLISVIVLSVVGGACTGVVIPLYFKKFFDIVSSGGNKNDLAVALVGVLVTIAAIEAIRWIFWRIAIFCNASFQTATMADLSQTCFEYLHKHSFSYFNSNFVGSLVKRVNWFIRAFESVADKIIWNILPLCINLTVVMLVLARRSLGLGLILIAWTIIFLIINYNLTKYKLKYDIQRNEAETKATGVLADTITNHTNVKLFNGYRREVERYRAATDKVRALRRLTWNLDGIFDAVQGLMVVVLEIGIFYFAIRLWQAGRLSVGDFVLIQSYIIILFDQVWNFGKMIRFLYSDLADAEEMTTLLNTPHEIQDSKNAKELEVKNGEVVFEDVDFNYHETRKILTKLNLIIRPNEKIALVGPSGAGKSTIVKLLLRMHDVTGGNIFIDGQKITDVTQESLWASTSLVPQDPILFHRTLMENIRYGKPDARDEEVVAAAKLAHCHEFISEFPEGYATFVGERGVKLSGGERQRVAIARAILKNAPVLVLDEATSSLDSESEHLIQDALNNLMKNKTVIVIAHRLSTIMRMDRIVVVNTGKIVEQGTHHELLATGGLYKDLWKLQAGGFMHEIPPATAEDDKMRAENQEKPKEDNVEFIEKNADFGTEKAATAPTLNEQPTL